MKKPKVIFGSMLPDPGKQSELQQWPSLAEVTMPAAKGVVMFVTGISKVYLDPFVGKNQMLLLQQGITFAFHSYFSDF